MSSEDELDQSSSSGSGSGSGDLYEGGQLTIQSIDLADCKELVQPIPIQASHCRKNVYMMMKDCPCKVADLKVSKTGKHGSTKANIVGYDVITGRKYNETVPGSTTMFEFTPVKVEYEVADISEGQITAMTADGQEKVFDLPATEVGEKLLKDFNANAAKNGDMFYMITVLYAPRLQGKKWLANMFVESYKPGKGSE